MSADQAAASFWEWSLGVYSDEQNQKSLLSIQDDLHGDINLTLWSIWTARNGWILDQQQTDKIVSPLVEFTRHVIHPLRSSRRALKKLNQSVPHEQRQAVRDRVLDIEISAEKLVQEGLARETWSLLGAPPANKGADTYEIARRHFTFCAHSLESLSMFDDDDTLGRADSLFSQIFDQSAAETVW